MEHRFREFKDTLPSQTKEPWHSRFPSASIPPPLFRQLEHFRALQPTGGNPLQGIFKPSQTWQRGYATTANHVVSQISEVETNENDQMIKQNVRTFHRHSLWKMELG